MRELHGSNQGIVLNAHAVVIFVTLFESAENGNGVFGSGFFNQNCLEAALESLVLLKILLIFFQSSGTNTAEFATRQGGFENVCRVHRALALASTDKRMDFVDKEDDIALSRRHFIDHALQAFLKFALIFRSRYERSHIEGVKMLILQIFRHVAAHNALCDTLNYGCFTRTRFADKNRIVLRATAQDLEHTANLIVAPNYGVEFAITGFFYEVTGIFL